MSVQLSSVNAGMPICIAFFPCCAPVLNSTFSPPVAGWQAPPVAPRLSQASLGRPFNATKCIAWHRRVECRSPPRPPPLSPLCNAMRSTRLRNRRLHFALHGCRAAFPLCNARRCRLCRCNAMHSAPLYSPAAECSATQTKFQDRAQLRPGQPVQGRAGNTQREVR